MRKRWMCLMASLFTLFSLTGCNQIKSAASKGYEKWKQKQYDYLDSIGGKKSDVKFNSCEYVYIEASGTMAVGTMKDSCYYDVVFTLYPNKNPYKYEGYFVYYADTDSIKEGATKSICDAAFVLVKDGSLKGTVGSL